MNRAALKRILERERHEVTQGKEVGSPSDTFPSPTPEVLVSHFLSMPLDQFERDGRPLEVLVEWMPVTLWFVPRGTDAEAMAQQGVSRGRIWTAQELMDLLAIADLPPERLRLIAIAKSEFNGQIIEVHKDCSQEGDRARQAP